MTDRIALILPDIWLPQLFSTKTAREVDRIVGRANCERVLRRRGHHAFENAG